MLKAMARDPVPVSLAAMSDVHAGAPSMLAVQSCVVPAAVTVKFAVAAGGEVLRTAATRATP